MNYSFRLNYFLQLALIILSFSVSTYHANGQVFEVINALQGDSLIQANAENPNFVILDVRRPTEYNPQHLYGAINRNYYDNDFTEQIDSLNKNKTYLIHCKAGGRANAAFTIMNDLGFTEVYNMAGGINAWNAESLPTTDSFAPYIMFVSDSIFSMKEIEIGTTDTTFITITNRANGILTFNNLCSEEPIEFSTNFDSGVQLSGAEDYTFQIYYTPNDEIADTLSFCIESENRTIHANIIRQGLDQTSNDKQPFISKLYVQPNPARDVLTVIHQSSGPFKLEVFNMHGQPVIKKDCLNTKQSLDVSGLQNGSYTIKISDQHMVQSVRFMKI